MSSRIQDQIRELKEELDLVERAIFLLERLRHLRHGTPKPNLKTKTAASLRKPAPRAKLQQRY